ncbi:MAG: glycosyltransferase [Bacteroidota bacterium]
MPLLPLLFWLFFGVILVQISYYLTFLFAYVSKPTSKIKGDETLAISIIICAKNEAANLENNIPLLLEQDHKNFELILVNDNSVDDSLVIMENYARRFPSVKVVNVKSVESFWGNKKYALTLGIKSATKPFLVFTDADCRPRSNKWLKHISSAFSKEKRIVIGYGAYKQVKGSLLNLIIRFETLLTAIQYYSYSNLGMTYMGVGRNLAYHKDVFFDNAGYMQHMDIMSGDDDLFINNVATKSNVSIMDHPNSATVSEPKRNFSNWFRQKRRHITTSIYYRPIHKVLLGSFYLSQISFFVLSVALLINLYRWPIVLGLIVTRFLISGIVFYKGAKKLQEKSLNIFAPFLEVCLIIIQFFIFNINLISKPKHWN